MLDRRRQQFLAAKGEPLIGMRGTLRERGLAVYMQRILTVTPDPYFSPRQQEAKIIPLPIKRKRTASIKPAVTSDLLAAMRNLLGIVELAPEVAEAFADEIAAARRLAA